MEIENLADPPPIVRQAEESILNKLDQMDAFELHDVGLKLQKDRSSNLLILAKSWTIMDDQNGFQQIDAGYKSIHEYVAKFHGKSKSTSTAIMRVWRKYVEDLGLDEERILDCNYNNLGILAAHINEENCEELMGEIESKSQNELRDMVKEWKGLEPEETEVEDDMTELKFKGNRESMAGIKTALEVAREEHEEGSDRKATNFNALEILSAHYLTSKSLSNTEQGTIEETLTRFAKVYGLKPIEWEYDETE